MKIHCLSTIFGEVVKVRLQIVDIRGSFVMIELLPQLGRMPTELSSLEVRCRTDRNSSDVDQEQKENLIYQYQTNSFRALVYS